MVHCPLFYNRAMRVTVGVSGGIAAYKAAELVRELQRQALEVHVVMTEAAMKFVQPLTFAALSGHKVITSLWDEGGSGADDRADVEGLAHRVEQQREPAFGAPAPVAVQPLHVGRAQLAGRESVLVEHIAKTAELRELYLASEAD